MIKTHNQTTINHARRLMNLYGTYGIPFLFIIDFDMEQPLVLPTHLIEPQNILYDLNGRRNYTPLTTDPEKKVMLQANPMSFEAYQTAFNQVQQGIKAGDTYLLNLTFPTPISINYNLEELFLNSEAKYKLLLKDQFVCFSPEIFVQIKNGQIASFPMKGTIDAAIPNAADLIMTDKKERAEHATIVDLIRNDLNLIAEKVQVERFRYIDEIQTHNRTLLQISSKITGQLPSNYCKKIGDILFQLLPAGSISGAPKEKTIELIKAAEKYKRGYYTGVFGYFDGKDLDSGVMIRFIEQDANGLVYKSGGGITTFSQVEAEYQELIQKIYVPIRRIHKSTSTKIP